MPKPSVANTQRLSLVPNVSMVRLVGSLSDAAMDELERAVCTVLGCAN